MANPSHNFPPLLGDGNGRYRVQIMGNSGVGKTTLGSSLAKLLGVPYISLDQIFWKPGWTDTPTEEALMKIREAMVQDPRGWVFDGNSNKRVGTLLDNERTDVIWLDPPLILYFPRLLLRTFLRLFHLHPPCSPGCFESPKEVFFSKKSIVWWCLTNHWVVQRRGKAMMKEIGLGIDGRGKMRRIGGWGGDLRRWWKDLEDMISLGKES